MSSWSSVGLGCISLLAVRYLLVLADAVEQCGAERSVERPGGAFMEMHEDSKS